VLTISGEQPYPGWSRRAAVHWTVGISRLGERLTGRGNSFPLPCLPRSSYLTSHRPPSRAFAEGYPDTSAGTSPTHACGAPPPPPLGAGQCPGVYQGSSRIRGVAGGKPYTGPWWLSPLGDSTIGGQNFPKINNVRKDRVDVVFIWWVC
jgi:hypothetical protein